MLPLPSDTGLTARRLDEKDTAALQALCEACVSFHLLIEGRPPRPDEAQHLLAELPPGKTLTDKFFFGLFTPRPRLCGALDLLRDYREPGEWYLGLLVLDPGHRSQGLGTKLMVALVHWLREQGARSLRLAVSEHNEAGRRFWERQGFEPVKQVIAEFGNKQSVFHVMRRTLEEP